MLNMNALSKANAMMQESTIWTLDIIVGEVARISFVLWNYRIPKNFEAIMKKLIVALYDRDDFFCTINVIMVEKSGDYVTDVVFTELMNIEEFVAWKDSDNDGFFIDLEDFKQNLWGGLRSHLIVRDYFEPVCAIPNDETI